MDLRRKLLFCCIALLQFLQCRSENSISEFVAASLCPNVSALAGRAEKSMMLCGIACSVDIHCELFHFNHTNRQCYHGNLTCEGLWKWIEGPCDSHKSVRPKSRPSPEPIADQLSLKLLYRFATHGLVNVADPSKYQLWSGSATTIDAHGAHFVTNSSSYLMTATPCFEKVINVGNTFSIFVRAMNPMNIDGTYVTMRDCDGNQVAQDFYIYNESFWHDMYWPAQPQHKLSKSGKVFTKSSSIALVSAGMTYDTDHAATYFFNGTVHPAQVASPSTSSNLTDSRFQCVQLGGYLSQEEYSVRGSMSCFALSTRLLTQAEFVQLDDWCKEV